MKRIYVMIAAVTFVVGFVLGAVLILANVTKKLETYCDDDGDVEELYRIDSDGGFKDKLKSIFD